MDGPNVRSRDPKRSWTAVNQRDNAGDRASVQRHEKLARGNHNPSTNQELMPGLMNAGICGSISSGPSQHVIGSREESSMKPHIERSKVWSAMDDAAAAQLQYRNGTLSRGTAQFLGHRSHPPTSPHIAPFADSDSHCNNQVSSHHSYGNIEVSGQANVQNGDQYNYYGSGAQLHGISYVSGNMIVNHSHDTTQEHARNLTVSDPDFELKKALYFDGMDARKAQLDIVDPASLEWIWSRTSFPQWLESDKPLYWISGKPASGKSTLINHLIGRDRERVIRVLEKRHENPLLLHFFFDFRSGNNVANSAVGFMRSLLLQLIDSSIHVKNYCRQHYSYRLPGDWPNDAKQSSAILIEALKGEKRLICGMIDGLDEYDGDLIDLLDILRRLQTSVRMKLCLSSRPDSRIAQQVGVASIAMQDYNSETISAYIDAAFSSLQVAKIYVSENELKILKGNIRDRASGVLLWVKFAVGEVLDVFHHGDALVDAIDRLQGLPTDLSDVYARILGRLNTEKRREAAVLLYIIRNWPPKVTENVYMVSLLTYHGIVMKKVYKRLTGFLTEKDICRFRQRLHSILGGLVDVVDDSKSCIWPLIGNATVRLTHETLNTFLGRDAPTQVYNDEIEQVFEPGCFATQVLADVVAMVSTAVDRNVVNTAFAGDKYRFLSRLSQQSPRAPGIYVDPNTIFLAAVHVYSAEPARINQCKSGVEHLLRLLQSWVFRWNNTSADQQYRKDLRGLSQNVWSLWDDHPEVFELIYHGYESVLEVLLEQDLSYLPDKTKDELRQSTITRGKIHGRKSPF